MKPTQGFLWGLCLTSSCFANPLQLDIQINVEFDDSPELDIAERVLNHAVSSTGPSTRPNVTLPYEIHLASPDKKTSQTFHAFENIPYAKQPVKELRFKEAQAIEEDRDTPPENDGSNTVVCHQQTPGWLPFAGDWSTQLFNISQELDKRYEEPIYPKHYAPLGEASAIQHQDEACLVLDVFVPKRVFDDESVPLKPVLVWFHGGGFVFGSKTDAGGPDGILKAAGEKGIDNDVLIVAVNYRLGAFGWLGGNQFRDEGGFENAGLSDQKMALEWVNRYIVAFGGDPYAVTVFGESAGASSIVHHLTAYGFDRSAKPQPHFQRAIIQSPGYFPITSQKEMNTTYKAFLKAAKVKTFAELQNAKPEDVIRANRETVYYSQYSSFTYGPVVSENRDRLTYVQIPPALKLQTGLWFSNVQLMIANNRREGSLFTPPWLRTAERLAAYIKERYPAMTNETITDFLALYPMPPTGEGDRVKTEREKFLEGAAAFGDLGIDCTVWAFRQVAPKDFTYQYYYRIYPGFHGQDVAATWYPESNKNLTELNVKAQSERLQRWMTCFAKDGNPNCNKKLFDQEFKPINDNGGNDRAMFIGLGVPVIGEDQAHSMSDERGGLPRDEICHFWNSAPYWEPDDVIVNPLRVQNGWESDL